MPLKSPHTLSCNTYTSRVLTPCMVLWLCAVCLCCACVVGMGLLFCAVLCGWCGSPVVGVAGGWSLGLFCSGLVGGALSLALIRARVGIGIKGRVA